ncbi:MAG: hypothetical protein F4X84_04495 [Synechococcus sp. SB0662_bin_45]|nr:hypothetical protein [Synechococcus sp. SB0668_bin_13]MYE21624.1 hypothetical protein [Synechococcus sp. SB0662_bin_45]
MGGVVFAGAGSLPCSPPLPSHTFFRHSRFCGNDERGLRYVSTNKGLESSVFWTIQVSSNPTMMDLEATRQESQTKRFPKVPTPFSFFMDTLLHSIFNFVLGVIFTVLTYEYKGWRSRQKQKIESRYFRCQENRFGFCIELQHRKGIILSFDQLRKIRMPLFGLGEFQRFIVSDKSFLKLALDLDDIEKLIQYIGSMDTEKRENFKYRNTCFYFKNRSYSRLGEEPIWLSIDTEPQDMLFWLGKSDFINFFQIIKKYKDEIESINAFELKEPSSPSLPSS